MPRILVIGATGTIGGQVATQLLDAGAKVRMGVRTPEKAQAFGARGAQLVHFDYDQPDTWASALDGIDRAFLVAPARADFAEPVIQLLDAAKKAGVRHIVRLSAKGVAAEAPFELARQHAKADAALEASGVGYTILRPTFFMDNFFNFNAHTILGDGAFYGASAGRPIAYVSSADIGAVAVSALTHPDQHHGQTYEVTGGEALTDAEAAKVIANHLGRSVQYVDLPPEQLAAGLRSAGVPDGMVEALVALEGVKAQGWAAPISPVVQQVSGRAPESLGSFLARTQA